MPDPRETIEGAVGAIRPPDQQARNAARALQRTLTKPSGALGRLEELHIWASGIFRTPVPHVDGKCIIVAAADHGVVEDDVSAYPAEVTAQMVRNFLEGGAAINVLARSAEARVVIVDAGVAKDIEDRRLNAAKVRQGTRNFTRAAAMDYWEAEELIARGITLAREECLRGAMVIGLGDMGIGNTTPAAAITSVMTGVPPSRAAGRGTGIDDEAFSHKVAAIEQGLAFNQPDRGDPVDVVSKVGGCEIAFLMGVAIGCAAAGRAVVIDGYPTTAAALLAAELAPASADYMFASHLSAEPGHRAGLEHLQLRPLLELDMRLGEGTGAALAMTLLDSALRIPREMSTFDAAGVSRSDTEVQPEG